jgi:Zinc-ribbon containing domain
MAAHAGEKAWRTGTFVCQVCNAKVRVQKSKVIPKCPNGHSTYDERVDEKGSESRSSTASHKRVRTSPRRATKKQTRSSGSKTSSSSRSRKTSSKSSSSRKSTSKKSSSGKRTSSRGKR